MRADDAAVCGTSVTVLECRGVRGAQVDTLEGHLLAWILNIARLSKELATEEAAWILCCRKLLLLPIDILLLAVDLQVLFLSCSCL